MCEGARILIESFAARPVSLHRFGSGSGSALATQARPVLLFSCGATIPPARILCKPAKSARPTFHHCPFFPLCITPPVGFTLARGRAVERTSPPRFKLFPTNHTDRHKRRCWLFGPVCRYSALGRAIDAVRALGRVRLPTVGASLREPVCHRSPSVNVTKNNHVLGYPRPGFFI